MTKMYETKGQCIKAFVEDCDCRFTSSELFLFFYHLSLTDMFNQYILANSLLFISPPHWMELFWFFFFWLLRFILSLQLHSSLPFRLSIVRPLNLGIDKECKKPLQINITVIPVFVVILFLKTHIKTSLTLIVHKTFSLR